MGTYHLIHNDRNTGVTTWIKGYFKNYNDAKNELDRIVHEYKKYPNLFDNYFISICEVCFTHVLNKD